MWTLLLSPDPSSEYMPAPLPSHSKDLECNSFPMRKLLCSASSRVTTDWWAGAWGSFKWSLGGNTSSAGGVFAPHIEAGPSIASIREKLIKKFWTNQCNDLHFKKLLASY